MNTAAIQATIRQLTAALGHDQVLTDDADKVSYSYDATHLAHRPDVVVFPKSTEDVQKVMTIAREHRVPVFTRGSGTGLSGGSIPLGGIALVMTRMNRILEIDRHDMLVRVEPGVLTADLKRAVEAEGLHYPVDPGSARISTIGGNIAENAGGPRAFQYGTTGQFVLGLEVVLADGSVIRTGGRTMKNVTGYDLTRLFVGSEGTLGVVTEATLRLMPPPPPGRGTLVASFSDLQSLGAAIGALAASPARPTSIEFFDRHCLGILETHRPPEVVPGAAGALLCEVLDWPEALPTRLEALTEVCRQHDAVAVTGVIDEDAAATHLGDAGGVVADDGPAASDENIRRCHGAYRQNSRVFGGLGGNSRTSQRGLDGVRTRRRRQLPPRRQCVTNGTKKKWAVSPKQSTPSSLRPCATEAR